MHFRSLILSALASVALAAIDEPCYGANGAAGVCIDSGKCTSKGGTFISGACPSDGANIKCCSKPACSVGACRWNSDCSGNSAVGQCPGPGGFKCCAQNTFGGYPTPHIPSVGACKANAVAGAHKVVNAWPGRIREIGCTRDCTCGSGSDHCCGKAIDFMCSDAGGAATLSGRQIAEWAMNRASDLHVKYIIWGQRIWQPSEGVKAWSSWKGMEDRNSITQNHWDHVHISFN